MSDASILIVDDQVENLLALEAVLEPLGQRVVRAGSGEEALARLLREDFALILLDVQMPDMDGFQTAAFIKRRDKTRHIPIIFLTALSKELHHVFRGYSAGAVDYVVKPFDPIVLRSKVAVFVDLYRKERALRESEARFRTAFDEAPIGICLASPEAKLTEVNSGLAKMLGYAEIELVGKDVWDILWPDDVGGAKKAWRRIVDDSDSGYRSEIRHRHRDGYPIWTRVNASVVRGENGEATQVIAQVEDITERKEAERERAARIEAEAVAETVGKLQAVTDTALRHLTLRELFGELLGRIRDTMGTDAASILLFGDHEAGEAFASGGAILPGGKEEIGVQIPVARDVARRIAGAGGSVAIESVQGVEVLHPLLHEAKVKSVAAAPLQVEGRLHGVLQVATTRKRTFTPEERALLSLIADRAALAIEHARLYEREHGIVETLQRALLPSRLPQVPGLTMSARYLPGGAGADVGGDWYDVVPLPDGRIGVAIGDVAGHGLRAATLMGQLRNSLRAYALEGHSPAAVVQRLNRIVRDLEQGWMATLFYAVLSADENVVTFSNAGHVPPLVLNGDGGRFVEDGRGPPLGIGEDDEHGEHQTELRPGSTLLIYTDGLVEEPGVPLDMQLARLAETALGAPPDPDGLCDGLLAGMLGEGEPRDDVAFLAVHLLTLAGPKVEFDLPADPKALSSVRRALGRWLVENGADEEDIYAVQLATHEACTNAIEHGYRFGDATVLVSASRKGKKVTIAVRDSGGWRGVGDGNRGRGFTLMEGLMDGVEVSPDREGTTVTMTRRLASARVESKA